MYTGFFQTSSLPADQLQGIYDIKLVILSILVAMMVSYIALDLTARLRDSTNTKQDIRLWLLGGCIAMGSGIWSMHFIGMLSFSIPGTVLEYEWFWTIFSLLVAILISFFALALLKKSNINIIHLLAGGIILGLGIASMHYTGMAAMLISLDINYLPGLFLISILVAILASEAALWFALKSNAVVLKLRTRIKILAAITMGFAISGMHYTGMAASIFTPLCKMISPVSLTQGSGGAGGLDPTILSVIIAVVTFMVLAMAFFASNYKESKNIQQFEKARELGIAEISASILHNVGNVLNSVSVSVETMLSRKKTSSLASIQKLALLFDEHKEDLPKFLAEDPRGVHVPAFINELSNSLVKEGGTETKELEEITKNIALLKSIISTQQGVIKVDDLELQIVDVNDLIEEVLLVSGVRLKKEIKITKKYQDLKPISINKIKLFQVLSNILFNAKDALLESHNPDKILTIHSYLVNKNKIAIEISDNGIGISKANLNQIFIFGFTTKKTGHGFGLHSTALAVNELGGEIHADSRGKDKGATFTIYLPYRQKRLF